ncbi:MAG: hypothetical protein O2910_00365 [Proteobacteria bacterium]|nr:hypothetical protein [Pseudomonadota bacterium]
MRRLFALLACLLIASPVAAEWPTTRYIPIPIGDPPFDGLNSSEDLTVDILDRGELMRDAFGVLTDVLRLAAIDSTKLEAAGFPAPLIQPLITESSTGDRYFPVRWVGNFGAPMQQGCYEGISGLTGDITSVRSK